MNELTHHGIKGQKWGVRRYQNEDGSLTTLGKRRLKLAGYSRVDLTKEIVDANKQKYKQLAHLKIDKNTKGYAYFNAGDLVSVINTETKKNGEKWIQGFEIFGQYKGKKLSRSILDVSVNELEAKYLSVNKKNKIAKSLYKTYGFKTYSESPDMDFMKI